MTSCSKELGPLPKPKRPLQITTRTLKEPDFKFELLPLHSPLLGQSLLVSFPPLIDMLKFSGYPLTLVEAFKHGRYHVVDLLEEVFPSCAGHLDIV